MQECHLNGQTPDITAENIEKLKQLFPEIITEGKVDFNKLRLVLGDSVDADNERYNFTWHGKAKTLRLSQTPSLGALLPCKEESKNWDATQNLYIEGDNLEVLKLLQKSYHGKVKMIYIDPPYNTGGDFVYPDDFSDNIQNYKHITGQVDGDGLAISNNSETSGRYHTDWLNMMYPRLRLARNLLTDDGVIFISIDDNEIAQLRKICDEVLGEANFIACLVWEKTRKNDARFFSTGHEYIAVYSKSEATLREKNIYWREDKPGASDIFAEYQRLREIYDDNFSEIEKQLKEFYAKLPKGHPAKKHMRYNKVDENGVWRDDNLSWPGGGGPEYDVIHPVTGLPCKVPTGGWRFPTIERMNEMIRAGVVVFRPDHTEPPIRKSYLVRKDGRRSDGDESVGKQVMGTYFYRSAIQATNELEALIGKRIFDYPKDREIIQRLINYITQPDSLILDFFSGSATTAHAVMQLNAEDGGNRKFIMVQLPEPCKEDSEAFKAGYKNICEIGKERIRRAGDKIKEEKGFEAQNLDIGFKVFKLDSSNIRKWQPDADNLELSLTDFVDNYVDGRTEFDVVYEIMLKYGLDLTYPVKERDISGKKIYSVGMGMLVICLDDELTTDIARGILKLKEELKPESMRVVFKDNGFHSDSNKTNIKEILKAGGVEEFVTI